MADIWKTFSFDLIERKKKNVDEATYHQTIENQLQLLGWTKYEGEINHKVDIQIGNHGRIQPDITIGKQPDWMFVIEVKRPSHSIQQKDISQLTSYMRQLKLNVGIYIGEDIEVFYDKADSSEDARCVYRIELKLDKNPRGEKFTDLFCKQNFSKEAVSRFCEDCIKEQEKQESLGRIRAQLLSANGSNDIGAFVLSGLSEKYSERFSSTELENMLRGLTFHAVEGTAQQDTQIKVYIHRNGLNSVGIFDGKGVKVLAGSPIAEKSSPMYERAAQREELVRQHSKRINGKLVLAHDCYFDTPSGASCFCLGHSSNGKKDWVDVNRKPLADYLK